MTVRIQVPSLAARVPDSAVPWVQVAPGALREIAAVAFAPSGPKSMANCPVAVDCAPAWSPPTYESPALPPVNPSSSTKTALIERMVGTPLTGAVCANRGATGRISTRSGDEKRSSVGGRSGLMSKGSPIPPSRNARLPPEPAMEPPSPPAAIWTCETPSAAARVVAEISVLPTMIGCTVVTAPTCEMASSRTICEPSGRRSTMLRPVMTRSSRGVSAGSRNAFLLGSSTNRRTRGGWVTPCACATR